MRRRQMFGCLVARRRDGLEEAAASCRTPTEHLPPAKNHYQNLTIGTGHSGQADE
ncbi:MAG: hypothetical protein IPN95_22400 [Bacteroidetes bacterium]|nr:hypothetical protein [Bacteroidota bacterium]